MKINSIYLLEQYIIGKDSDKYEILENIYDDQAEVEFEIRSTAISFPGNISGNKDIAKNLSADFNKKYERVKTYYLCRIDPNRYDIQNQPWLVVMKEIGNNTTRIGAGYYDWTIRKSGNGFRIKRHKIYIHTMLEINDANSVLLEKLQSHLEYPWVDRNEVVEFLSHYPNLSDVREYLMNEHKMNMNSLN